eukprot:COSAG05_NODE_57_length_23291_cov_75.862668_18_plen_50_part_00
MANRSPRVACGFTTDRLFASFIPEYICHNTKSSQFVDTLYTVLYRSKYE